jgi:hypothetical protein
MASGAKPSTAPRLTPSVDGFVAALLAMTAMTGGDGDDGR